MSHIDLCQPDLAAPCAAAGDAEFTEAEARLLNNYGHRLGGADPLASLPRDISRSLTDAGLTLDPCATHDPLYRLGVIGLLLIPAEAGDAPWRGLGVADHSRPAAGDQLRYRIHRDTHQTMNGALGSVLTAFGYRVASFGSGGVWLVTSRYTPGTETEQ